MKPKAYLLGTWNWLYPKFPDLMGYGIRQALPTPPKLVLGSSSLAMRLLMNRYKTGIQNPLPSFRQHRPGRLIIQLHHAKRANDHYDFRLTGIRKGLAISWASKKLLGSAPKIRLVRTDDHREDFGTNPPDFIPPGQYGAGKPGMPLYEKVIDCPVTFVESRPDSITLWADLGAGEQKFVLRDTTTGWLGICVTPPISVIPDMTRQSMKVGRIEGRANEQCSDYITTRKIDGAHTFALISGKTARFFSHRVSKVSNRQIEYTPKIKHLADLTRPLKDTRVHGELWHPKGASFLAGLLNTKSVTTAIANGADKVQFAMFDVSWFNGRDVRGLPYKQRFELLYEIARLTNLAVVPRQHQGTIGTFFDSVTKDHVIPQDGVVIANKEAPYQAGLFGEKLKLMNPIDGVVKAILPGRLGFSKFLGALLVEVPDEAGGVKEVHVGTGFTKWEREWIWNRREQLIGEVVQVGFTARTSLSRTGSRFLGWHSSKSEVGLQMYSEAIDPKDPSLIYRLKAAVGWRKKS